MLSFTHFPVFYFSNPSPALSLLLKEEYTFIGAYEKRLFKLATEKQITFDSQESLETIERQIGAACPDEALYL